MKGGGGEYFNQHPNIELTPQQFMEGYVKPTMEGYCLDDVKETLHIHKGNTKPDAFVIEAKDGYVYLWTEKSKRQKEAPGSLYMYNLIHANEYFAKHTGPQRVTEFKKYCVDDVNDGGKFGPLDSGESKKPDAYIYSDVLFIWEKGDNKIVQRGDIRHYQGTLHQYNLMSEKAFRVKHLEKPKFKEWEVTKGRSSTIKIGSESFSKHKLALFSKTMQTLNTHQVNAKEFYTFLYCNKEKLGLDF
ncbi:hypothetical protein KA005_51145 [bacterium]|nr:hypothetical protein [bacterium]